MWQSFYKVLAVFVTVVAVSMMGASLATFFVHPDPRAEMNTPAMQKYTFAQTASGDRIQWTVTRRFSVDPAKPADRSAVGTYATPYEALTKAHADLKNFLTQQTSPLVEQKNAADTQSAAFLATQQQDAEAIQRRIQGLQVVAEQRTIELQKKSEELQALSVKSKEIRDETASRRTDVLRLRHELEEARTDLYRLTTIRRDLTDRLVRLEIENDELNTRKSQLAGQSAGYDGDQAN